MHICIFKTFNHLMLPIPSSISTSFLFNQTNASIGGISKFTHSFTCAWIRSFHQSTRLFVCRTIHRLQRHECTTTKLFTFAATSFTTNPTCFTLGCHTIQIHQKCQLHSSARAPAFAGGLFSYEKRPPWAKWSALRTPPFSHG